MTAWRVALQCGYPHPDRMLEELSGDQWHELLDFQELDPSGEQRADVRHAHMMTLLARVNGDKSSSPEKFMPFLVHEPEFKPAKPDEVKRRLQGLFGGKPSGRQRR